MADLIVILLYVCKLAFLASSTCVKIIEFSLKNEARKAYLHTAISINVVGLKTGPQGDVGFSWIKFIKINLRPVQ